MPMRIYSVLMVTVLLVSLSLFFLVPHHEYIPKLMCALIAGILCLRNYLQGIRRNALIFGFATAAILLTLPSGALVKDVEIGLLVVGMLVLTILRRFTRT